MQDIYEDLRRRLENVSKQYPDFVDSIISELKHSVNKNPNAAKQLLDYLESDTDLDAYKVTLYETQLIGVPLPDENGNYFRFGKKISAEEAQKIIESEYCDN